MSTDFEIFNRPFPLMILLMVALGILLFILLQCAASLLLHYTCSYCAPNINSSEGVQYLE